MGQWVHRASMRRCERHTAVRERRRALQTARTRHRQPRKIMTTLDFLKKDEQLKVSNCSNNRQLFISTPTKLFITLESKVLNMSTSLLMLRDRTNRWNVSTGTVWSIHPEPGVDQTGPPWNTGTFYHVLSNDSSKRLLTCIYKLAKDVEGQSLIHGGKRTWKSFKILRTSSLWAEELLSCWEWPFVSTRGHSSPSEIFTLRSRDKNKCSYQSATGAPSPPGVHICARQSYCAVCCWVRGRSCAWLCVGGSPEAGFSVQTKEKNLCHVGSQWAYVCVHILAWR